MSFFFNHPYIFLVVSIVAIALVGFFCGIRQTNSALRNASPALCLSTGLLCTFFGIGVSLQAVDATEGINAVLTLMSGLKTAFWSSVAGLLSSIVLKIHLLSKKVEQPSPNDFLNKLNQHHTNLIEKIDTFTNTIATKLSETLSSSVDQVLADLPNRIELAGGKLSEVSSDLQSINSEHKQNIDNWQTFVSAFTQQNLDSIEALKDTITPFSEAINQQQQWFEQSANHLNSIAELKDKAHESLTTQTQVMENYDTFAETIQAALEKHQQAYSIELAKITDNLTKDLQTFDIAIAEQFKKQLDHQDELLVSLLNTASTGIAKESEESLNRLAAAMRDIIDHTMDSFKDTSYELKTLNEDLATHTKKQRETLETLTEESVDNV